MAGACPRTWIDDVSDHTTIQMANMPPMPYKTVFFDVGGTPANHSTPKDLNRQ